MSSGTALHSVDNVETARKLLESVDLCRQKEFILSVDENGYTALHLAADSGKTDVVEYLCSLFLEVDELILKKSADGWTALHCAQNREIAKLLVESIPLEHQKTFMMSVDQIQRTALHLAAACGRTYVVEYLCSLSTADDELILKRNADGCTALHYAANREIAQLLVESVLPEHQRAFILPVDESKGTALHEAAACGRTDVVEYLCNWSLVDDQLILEKYADGWTALHFAKNKEIAKLLVESVLPENQTNLILSGTGDQSTALHIAAIFERTQVVEYLCGFTELSVPLIFGQDSCNRTALHVATNKTIVSCLLSRLQVEEIGKLLSLLDYEGNTPILSLARFGQYESLAELFQHIENKTDLNMKTYLEQHNYAGQNILHLAALAFPLNNTYDVLQDYVGYLNFEKLMATHQFIMLLPNMTLESLPT